MEKLNLYQKIQAVGNEIRNIEKGLTVGSGSYSYKAVGDLDVTLAVKDAEEKYKLVSIPVKQELINSEIVRTHKKDGTDSLTFVDTIKMTLRIVDTEDTTQFIEVESFGKGIDSGDKGFGKASTYARKCALLNVYKIASGEDPDAEKSKEITVITNDVKKNEVTSYLNKNNKQLINILSHFNVNSIDDLTEDQMNMTYGQLKGKRLI